MSYPLKFPDDDPRFSDALIEEISATLAGHGYTWDNNDDAATAGLRAALAGFLYGPAFNRGDKVTWVSDNKVYSGKVEYVATGDNGPVARIDASPQPGGLCRFTTVVPCRNLTLVRDGA